MFYRKDAVLMAVAGLLATSGFAMADTPKTTLSLDPVVTADDAAAAAAPAPAAPLMGLLEKAGVGKPMEDMGLNIYGWIESGYTYNHRHFSPTPATAGQPEIIPGPFNHEAGNHYMLNQVDLRFERLVDSKKFDVGGLIEVLYGTDASLTHSAGLPFGGTDPSSDTGGDTGPVDKVNDKWQANYGFDIPQAYVDVNIPIGNGLKIRTGRFVTLLGYETIDPRGNPFYSHSFLFSALPFTQTGVLGIYQINDQWSVTGGVTRGWDMSLEDTNSAVDGLGQVAWTPNKQWSVYLNWSVGPQNFQDSSHYRTVVDPIVTWQVTDALKLAAEGLYLYDGGLNAAATGSTHSYGDIWGGALYASYTLNEYFTLNGRAEKAHIYDAGYGGYAPVYPTAVNLLPARNAYEITVGLTIVPMPKDPIFKNLSVRPEVRYDFYDGTAYKFYPAGNDVYKNQLTFGADVIFTF
jgi:hypothetical protein